MLKRLIALMLIAGSCSGADVILGSISDGFTYSSFDANNVIVSFGGITSWTDPNSANLVAIYYMEQTNGTSVFTDSWTNNFDGTPMPSVATGPTAGIDLGNRPDGKQETATDFDGGNDCILLSDDPKWSFGNGTTDKPFTVMAWINPDTTAGVMYLLNKDDNASNREYYWRLEPGGAMLLLLFDAPGYRYITTLPVSTGVWTHVACTYSGVGGTSAQNGLTAYTNGILSPSTASASGTYVAMSDGTYAPEIGRRGNSGYFNGLMDDFRPYSAELSSNAVWTIFDNTRHPTNSIETRLNQ